MTTPIEIRDLSAQRLLVKKTTCAHKDIGPAFSAAIRSVGECVKTSEAKMASAPVAVYLNWRTSDCDMAVGFQVEGNITLAQGCEWLDLPGGPHAVASYFGSYDGLPETHETMHNWCAANGKQLSGSCWESYPVDPGSEPDASKWQTDVHYPVRE
jgi:effector-binding domain-containing protein